MEATSCYSAAPKHACICIATCRQPMGLWCVWSFSQSRYVNAAASAAACFGLRSYDVR